MSISRRIAAVLAVAAVSLAPTTLLAGAPQLGWSDLHDGGANQLDDGYVALTDASGNAIVGGVRTAPGGFGDVFIRKLGRSDGLTDWTFVYADPGGNDMALADMVIDHRGDIMVAGYLSSCDS